MSTATELAANASTAALETRLAAIDAAIAGLIASGGGGGSSVYYGPAVYNVKQFGAVGDGVADDTATIQAAIDACKAATYRGVVYLPPGMYSITRLNLTGIGGGFTFQGDGWNSSRIVARGHASYGTSTGHLLDCSGSKLKIKGLQIGFFNQIPVPTTGIFLSQSSGNASDMTHIEDCYISGSYTVAAVYNYGAPSGSMLRCQVYNYHTAASQYVAIWTNTNISGLASDFATVPAPFVGISTSDWTFTACEWHRFGGLSVGVCWIWDAVSNMTFIGGNITAGGSAYVWANGTCKFVYVLGTTFETESQPMPANIVWCTGTLTTHFPPTHEDITGARFSGAVTLI